MTDLPRTVRWALPLLAVAQAQKEITHNEALTLLDVLVQSAVEDGPQAAPPIAPDIGQCWIVGAAPTGAWAAQAGALALWTSGGWRFVVPRTGMRLTRLSDGARLRFEATGWVEPTLVANPAGGTSVDVEARAAIEALKIGLAAHGLIISG